MISIRTIAIFIAILLVTVMLTFGPDLSKTPLVNQRVCVDTPDPLHTIQYNGVSYRRIRIGASIFAAEIPIHFEPTQPGQLSVEGTYRPAYIPWNDGDLDGKYINWRPIAGVDLLLFVDKGISQTDPGFHDFDVYLRPVSAKNYTLPKFIENFCASNFSIVKKSLAPDSNGDIFPPTSFTVSDLTNWLSGQGSRDGRPDNVPYYLLTYDIEGTPTWGLTLQSGWPTAELTVTGRGSTKRYKAIYVPSSAIKYILLIDMDPSNTSPKIGYRYTFASGEFQPSYPVTPITVNPTMPNLHMETFNFPGINAWGWWNPD